MRYRDVPVEPPEAEFPPWLRSTSHVWAEPTIDPNWHRDDGCPFEPNGRMDDPRPIARYQPVISPADASAWVMTFGRYKGKTLGEIKARKRVPLPRLAIQSGMAPEDRRPPCRHARRRPEGRST